MKDDVPKQADDTLPIGAIAEPQRNEASGEESAPMYDVVIFCHPRNVANLVQAFEMEIKDAAGELPLFVLWSGVTGVLHQGMIVLECEGQPPAAFLQNLSIDHEIFDYAAWQSEDNQEGVRRMS